MSAYSEFGGNLPARTAAEPVATARPGNLAAIIGRIEEAIDDETAGIRASSSFDRRQPCRFQPTYPNPC